jgi:hypothetical protein
MNDDDLCEQGEQSFVFSEVVDGVNEETVMLVVEEVMRRMSLERE